MSRLLLRYQQEGKTLRHRQGIMNDMADDQVLADLQRLMSVSSGANAADPLGELEALAKEHEQRIEALIKKYHAQRAALEAKIAARLGATDQQSREAEIARIKAELKPAA